MKRISFLCMAIGLTLVACAQQASSLKVVLIRHGEKDDNTNSLSCQGLHRALMLPPVLNGKFGKPAYIYVPSVTNGKTSSHSRMFQTATPTAVTDGVAIDSKYGQEDDNDVAADILTRSGLVLVVWEHTNIPKIAKALGVKDQDLHWDANDFDSIWIVTFDISKKGKQKATLTKDSEGLHPPATCSF